MSEQSSLLFKAPYRKQMLIPSVVFSIGQVLILTMLPGVIKEGIAIALWIAMIAYWKISPSFKANYNIIALQNTGLSLIYKIWKTSLQVGFLIFLLLLGLIFILGAVVSLLDGAVISIFSKDIGYFLTFLMAIAATEIIYWVSVLFLSAVAIFKYSIESKNNESQ